MKKINDLMLKENLGKITSQIKRKIKQTSQDVWGAEIIRINMSNGNYNSERYTLETWTITLSIQEDMDIETLCDMFAYCAYCYDEKQKKEYQGNSDKYTCYMLCDWNWLADDIGHIIRNGKATLVKYAKILKN